MQFESAKNKVLFMIGEMYYVKRICYADHESISLEEIIIPKYIAPKLEGIGLNVFSLKPINFMADVQTCKNETARDKYAWN